MGVFELLATNQVGLSLPYYCMDQMKCLSHSLVNGKCLTILLANYPELDNLALVIKVPSGRI